MITIDNQHLNPCKVKVSCPILKLSVNNQISRKASCPQITKIRNNKSSSNLQSHHPSNNNVGKQTKKKIIQNDENCIINSHKKYNLNRPASTNYILASIQNICINDNPIKPQLKTHMKFNDKSCLSVKIQQNIKLTKQLNDQQKKLSQVQKQHQKLQQKYIRLLQVSNQRSQSHIKIFMEQSQSRLNKSKLKASMIASQTQKIKQKLQGLDLSNIKSNQDNSFKLSQMLC